MKLVIQRVNKASVSVNTKIVGEIGKGLFILVGIKKGDTKETVLQLAEKIIKMRVMSDDNDKMNLSVVDSKSKILAVSQFTLYANTDGGNRPSFLDAETPDKAIELYNLFVDSLRNKGIKVETGLFGEYMTIYSELDGPVTIVLEK